MLDADISSTQCIARLWRLGPAEGRGEKAPRRDGTTLPATTTPLLNHREAPLPRGPRPFNIPADGVRKVIEDALRTAGLMK
jgi:hypothetical protein